MSRIVVITGASGLVGRALSEALEAKGWQVRKLGRSPASAYRWDPVQGALSEDVFEGAEAVVHLAGENVAGGRWSRARRQRIRESRVQGTQLLAGVLAKLPEPPKTFLSASAIGYYGVGAGPVSEGAACGEGFLAEVCEAWEAAAEPARKAGLRVAHPRIGMVLSRHGGALAKMLPAFRLGLGGPLGSGCARVSWITLEDLVSALHFALETEALEGPFNVCAPEHPAQRDFARSLGQALRRPACLPLPAFLLRWLLGDMAEEMLLNDLAVEPSRLRETGFTFEHPTLATAWPAVLS